MLAACPECNAPYVGNPPTRKAARVCKSCGHAFLLHPDGTVESLKKEAPKPAEPEPVAAPVTPPTDIAAVVSALPSDAPPPAEYPAGEVTPVMPVAGLEAASSMANPASSWPAATQAQPVAPVPTPWSVPAAPQNGVSEDDIEPPSPKRSRALLALLPLMLVLGAGLGYGAAQFVPALKAKPPPPPPAPAAVAPSTPAPPAKMFITADEPLFAGPSSTGAYAQLVVLPKASAVFATTAQVDAFVLVRDMMGRAGFVRNAALTPKRPSAAFVDCARAPFEPDSAACQARASEQLEACSATCTDAPCKDACQEGHGDCTTGCAQLGTVGAAVSSPPEPPTPERATPSKKAKGKAKKRGPAKGGDKGGSTGGIPLPEPE